MQAQATLLKPCFEHVQAQAQAMLARCLEAACADLQASEAACRDLRERDTIGEAWRALQRHKPALLGALPGQALAALQAQAENALGASSTQAAQLAAAADWALEDSATTQASIEVSRLLQSLLVALDNERTLLDALVSSVLGHDTVRTELNPLRPEVFAKLLTQALDAVEPSAPQRALCLRSLTAPWGHELKGLYKALIADLQSAGVRAAGYRVKLTLESAGMQRMQAQSSATAPAGTDATVPGAAGSGFMAMPVAAAPGSWVQGLPGMPQLAQAHSAVAHPVFQQFLSAGSAGFDQPLASDYFAAVDAQLAALEHDAHDYAALQALQAPDLQQQHLERRSQPAVERAYQAVGVASQLSAQAWGSLAQPHARTRQLMQRKREATRVAQVVGLDVVRTLVNQVGQDPRLLPPVREAVVALEPALLRMAMAQPRFFGEDQHPARLLVEAVAQRSFKYNDEFASEFAGFFEQVRTAFQALDAAQTDEPGAFAAALQHLQAQWQVQDQAEQAAQDEGLQSIRFAEQRQGLADQEAWELSKRPDLEGVPARVLDFIYETWSLVLAHARLCDTRDQLDPGGYRAAVSDLLWSVKKEVTIKRPARLIEMVPSLVQTLHSGLALLGKDRQETQSFFDALMRLHNPVLKLRRARSRRDAIASALGDLEPAYTEPEMHEEPLTEPVRGPGRAEQPWLARNELDAAGFQDTLPSDYAALAPAGTAAVAQGHAGSAALPGSPPSPANAGLGIEETAAVLASLREGDWVDLYSKRQWLRAQLMWASTKGTLFMFISRGGRPHSMTKRICERLITERLLRPLGMQAVVERALGTVLAETH